MTAERPLEWVFDPAPPSGQVVGGLTSAHVFDPGLDTFVREILQNSHDQRLPGKTARVRFTFSRLSGTRRDRILDVIDWPTLRKHLKASGKRVIPLALRVRRELKRLDQGNPLLLLQVDDSGTLGLTGDEDSETGNFNALCRNELVPTGDRPGRGGAFGLGKAVLWQFSGLSTVLFSSRIQDDAETRLRVFGRAELPNHKAMGGQWRGPGWFGLQERTNAGPRAVSVWDEIAEEVARTTGLFRPVQFGTGTSILVVGFGEPTAGAPRELRQIARDILISASKWFWPSMHLSQPTLEVSAAVREEGSLVYDETAKPTAETLPFVHAASSTDLATKASEAGQVASTGITFNIPARTAEPVEIGIEAAANLSLTRMEGEEGMEVLANRIAVYRGAGFVVKYLQPSRGTLGDLPFFGVLRAGLSNGDSPEDESLERFLRAAEPPAHNNWTLTERLRTEYARGSKVQLDRLWEKTGYAVLKLCAAAEPDSDEGPRRLSHLLRVGGSGTSGPNPVKFRVLDLDATLDSGVWRFAGRVRRETGRKRPWQFLVAAWLDGETGQGDRLPLSAVVVTNTDQAIIVPDRLGQYICQLPASLKEARFKGETKAVPTSRSKIDIRQTRMRLEIRPQEGSS